MSLNIKWQIISCNIIQHMFHMKNWVNVLLLYVLKVLKASPTVSCCYLQNGSLPVRSQQKPLLQWIVELVMFEHSVAVSGHTLPPGKKNISNSKMHNDQLNWVGKVQGNILDCITPWHLNSKSFKIRKSRQAVLISLQSVYIKFSSARMTLAEPMLIFQKYWQY